MTPRTPEILIFNVGIAGIRDFPVTSQTPDRALPPDVRHGSALPAYFLILSLDQSSSSAAFVFSLASTMMRIIDSVFDART